MRKLLVATLVALALMLASPVLGKSVTATYTYGDPAVDGFRLYDNGILLCELADPTARTMVCEATLGFGAHSFTMTAYSAAVESPHSVAFPMVINLLSPGLGSVTVED